MDCAEYTYNVIANRYRVGVSRMLPVEFGLGVKIASLLMLNVGNNVRYNITCTEEEYLL